MTQRLPPQPGEWIDRSRPLEFKFEGQSYSGFAGDTITSALAAAGVRMLGRSFKYHRPRGVYSLANHDVNVMLEDGQRTNIRGDVTPLVAGANLRVVNTFGGLRHDRARIVDRFSKFLPVGFYYKAFHRPRRWFPFYERRMREMAGLGAIDSRQPRKHTPSAFDFCDVLVIGAGPAGLSAAIAAAQSGAQVVVVDEQQRAGGSLNYQGRGNPAATALLGRLLAEARLPNLEIRTATVAAGCYADHWIALVDEQRMTKMRARSVIMATGCFEQPAVFGNNDLPGVMLASAAQRLIHQFAVKPFERGSVLTASVEGYRAALDLHRAGVTVEAVIDLRKAGEDDALVREVPRAARIRIEIGHTIYRAVRNRDKSGVNGLLACPLDAGGRPVKSQTYELDGDGLAMSVGWAPADGLYYQSGGRMTWSELLQQFIPDSTTAGLFAAGRLNGIYPLEDRVADGRQQGLAAAAFLGLAQTQAPGEAIRSLASPNHPYPIYPDSEAKSFVDLDEDVHFKDFVDAAQEGFDQVELMKRYSTFGMGPSQGKLSNLAAVRILARIKDQTVAETGVTRSRPFFHPVPLAHLAGRGFHPHRFTPLDGRHVAAGAMFMPAGDWRRPAYYAIAGKSAAMSIAEEVLAVRQRVGLIDVGTLGKIEVNGPDSGALLERIYTGRYSKMKIGTARYALMCDEAGVIIDDGMVGRLAEDRFYVTTTTTASAAVYREMQRHAIVWGSQVVLNNATGHYGAINLAGPRSREILRQLCDFDVSAAAFPYLAIREGRLADVPGRFMRVGFVGELGCEIHVPASSAGRVWDALVAAGQRLGIRPFGVEAQRVLRLEKAHVIISQDTDGLTNPLEANMAWAVKNDKPFFIGQRSLQIIGRKPLARLLVGFMLEETPPPERLPKECHLIIDRDQIVGRVTSITLSPTLDKVIGLCFLEPQRAKPGQRFEIRIDDGSLVAATVVETPFYDPKNLRQTETNPAS